MKKVIFIGLVLLLVFTLVACQSDEEPATNDNEDEWITLTLEELEAYNGLANMPAFIAYEGKIYDVSDHPEWTDGEHGGNMAGQDITDKLKDAPHGTSKLDDLTQVGEIIEE